MTSPRADSTGSQDMMEKGACCNGQCQCRNYYHDLRQVSPPPLPVRGNPGPFGLLCFGLTTDMLMFILTSWTTGGFEPVVIAYAAFYGGLGQFIAGILELIRGSTFAGTAFSSYGCFWMGWAFWKYMEVTATVPSVLGAARTGDTLWCGLWGFLTLAFFVVTLRKNAGLQAVFSSLFITFFLLCGANYSARCKKAAGYVGFFCGTSAIYTAIAELYKDELGWSLPGVAPTYYVGRSKEQAKEKQDKPSPCVCLEVKQ